MRSARTLFLASMVLGLSTLLSACSEEETVPTEIHLQGLYEDPSGLDMRYLVWLPPGYGEDRDKRHPMIVFLHGSGDDDYDAAFVASYGLPAVIAQGDQPDGFDFVVISPQATPGGTWYNGVQPQLVDGIVQTALDTYLVDPDRVYLTGLSMGGYGSWHIAARYPERYAAMVSISGSGFQVSPMPSTDYMCPLSEVPVWGIHGEKDLIAAYLAIESQVAQYERLCDVKVGWTALPDDGHFSTYQRAYREPLTYEWMLDHTNS